MTAVRTGILVNTPEWEAARRQGVGASDIPVICGESPYQSAYALWAEKSGLVEPEHDEETLELFELGHLFEDDLLTVYERRSGRKPSRVPEMLAHRELPWARASLDGKAPRRRVVEAKWTNAIRWTKTSGVPFDVELQCQWQMFVTGWQVADVVALVGQRARVVEVPRDDALIADILPLAEDFWRRVQTGRAPDVDGSEATRRAIARIWREPTGPMLPAAPDLVDLVMALRVAKDDVRAAKDREATVANALRAVIAEAEGIDGLVTYRRNADSTRIDWQAVAEELGRQLTAEEWAQVKAENTTTVEGPRVLRLKGEKE